MTNILTKIFIKRFEKLTKLWLILIEIEIFNNIAFKKNRQ